MPSAQTELTVAGMASFNSHPSLLHHLGQTSSDDSDA
eukprot:CAMPEP_0119087120 /NCGR_PEP_ID=MMETSP1178-20130426/140487_1 /TAXON_ID=33656 /ORGANISM="unid sp, Strain CCMP2000" /LENGTH=36 /DNA_ID= /DNA_START= /DNA_END= /DNA_ORIENTATION=